MAVLHTKFRCKFSTNINSIATARNKSIFPLLVPVSILYSQPFLHFFTNLITTPNPSRTDDIFECPKEGEICDSKTLTVRWLGKTSPCEVWDCILYFQKCVWLCVVLEDFSDINLLKPTGTWCTNRFLSFNNCTFCSHCIYMFCIYLRTNSDFCPIQHNWFLKPR